MTRNRAHSQPESGLALDTSNEVYDVTEWRKRVEALLGGGTPGDPLDVQIVGSDGETKAEVDDEGQLHIVAEGKLCELNSTTTTLAGDETWTGQAVKITAYNALALFVTSDVAGVVNVQYSRDGVNDWRTAESYDIDAGAEKWFTPPAFGVYLRISYTNGASAQSSFELTMVLRKLPIKWSSHNIEDPIKDQDDAELTKSVITGKKDNGTFDNASLTNGGNFKVAVQEYGDTPSIDAFDRLRVSEPFTIFDSKQLHDKQPLLWDEVLGGTATSVHTPADAAVTLSVAADSTDYAIRQTKQRFNYQPGKSQLVFFTARSPQTTGVTSRAGLFEGTGVDYMTPNNGIFFQCDGTASWNIAKNGSTTETVTQSNWNVDPLDGTGPSELTLDLSAPFIGVIDFEWLGVGRTRVGFVIGGLIYYVHYFNHANDPAFDSVYMSTPNLPLRYDIQGSGTNDAGELDHICSSVISEGGIQETGILRVADTGTTTINAAASGTIYALVGIRLKSSYLDTTIIPVGFSMIATTNDAFRWSLCLNPTIAGTFTYSDLTNSAVQKATGATTNTVSDEGVVIASGYASASSRSAGQDLLTALRLGATIAGTRDTLVLCVAPMSNNATMLASLNFRELL